MKLYTTKHFNDPRAIEIDFKTTLICDNDTYC